MATVPEDSCPQCLKPRALCLCAQIAPVENRIELLILQHPQEQDVELGTARLAVASLARATLRIGLSWPSLAKALGRPADPKKWGVLYLGSAKLTGSPEVAAVTRKGTPHPDGEQCLAGLEGVILLDGSWGQAKALWWRNAWLLKCQRIVLAPRRPSRYGKLRREARSDAVSTIEAAALLIAHIEKRPDIGQHMTAAFEELLARYAALHTTR